MAGQTPLYHFPYPDFPDLPVVPTDMNKLAVAISEQLYKTDGRAKDTRERVTDLENRMGEIDSGTGKFPAGSIMQFGGYNIPYGWFLCDGRSIPTAQWPNLFAAIGHLYGGSGSNFRIPDFRGRFPLGWDSRVWYASKPGESHGADQVTLNNNHLPSHSHTISHSHTGTANAAGLHDHAIQTQGDSGSGKHTTTWVAVGGRTNRSPIRADGTHTHSLSTGGPSQGSSGRAGGGLPFYVVPKFTAVGFMIKG